MLVTQPIHPFASRCAFSMRLIVCGGIFLETVFCQRVACSLAWEGRGLLNGHCITLKWAHCYSSRLLECDSKPSAWKTASVVLPLIFQNQGSCCHSPSMIQEGAKWACSWAPFQPMCLFPLSFGLCYMSFGFSEALERLEVTFCLALVFAEAVLQHGQVWFLYVCLKKWKG